MSLKAISLDSIGVRVATVAIGVGILFIGAFTFVWALANNAALGASQKEVAQGIVELSPSDPQTHFTTAVQHEKTFEIGDLNIALAEYEKAAALSPYSYQFWIELGSARARAGEETAAEAAFRRARELAPNYSRVHWALGNLLLRKGSDEEAYSEIRAAVEGDRTYALPAATIALQMADGNWEAVRTRFRGLPHAEAALASLLAGQKKFDEAADVWSNVRFDSADEKMLDVARLLKLGFYEGKHFRMAAGVAAQMPGANGPVVGSITNSGFELPVKTEGAGEFDWRVSPMSHPQIAVTEGQKRSGRYSLISLFNPADKDFRGFSQVVAVQPGTTYELKVPYRSDIKSKVSYYWEIVSAGDSKRLALSSPLLPSTDWTDLSTTFSVPAETDGIEIRFVRGDCIASGCATSGSFWFDDISLSAK